MAYLGPPVALYDLLHRPPAGLVRQSYAPRRQRHGTVNADGFGVGWYRPEAASPARYRRAVPIWADPNLAELATGTRSRAIVAAVRSATPGHALDEGACAPFRHGPWLFSHNGALPGWPECADALASDLPPSALARQQTLTDSTLLWAILLAQLDAGADAAAATGALAARARAHTGGRVNLLLHDGRRILATTAGDSLCYRYGSHPDADGRPAPGVIVASEPFDDTEGWVDVPDDHLLVATERGVTLSPLAELPSTRTPPPMPEEVPS